jgi:hypothetical protein
MTISMRRAPAFKNCPLIFADHLLVFKVNAIALALDVLLTGENFCFTMSERSRKK